MAPQKEYSRDIVRYFEEFSDTDPEYIKPGGAKSINFELCIMANRGRAPGAPLLNPRLVLIHLNNYYILYIFCRVKLLTYRCDRQFLNVFNVIIAAN